MADAALICVVDDDELVRTSLSNLMLASGFRAACFANSEAFLASDQKAECHCIVADIHMSGLTGIELKKRLIAEGSRTPVIIITGDPRDYWRESAARSGAVGFLHKPFEPRRLLELLAQSMAA